MIKKQLQTTKLLSCPCGGSDYAACCGRYHGDTPAPDAESLMKPLAIHLGRQQTPANALDIMRSRYCAYVLKLDAYLLATWHTDTRPASLDLASNDTKWLGLEVKKHIVTDADRATVEFVARYKIGGRAHRLHEISQFVRQDERWFYVDGELDEC